MRPRSVAPRSLRPLRTSAARLAALCCGAALACSSQRASAQSAATDAASRVALLEQAQREREQGHHAEALNIAERAGRIEMTPSLRLFIAQELETLGRFGDALGSAQLCVREAERAPALRLRDEIIAACRELAQRTQPRVARVVITPPDPLPRGFTVRIGAHTIGESFYGLPYVVGPGPALVEASAPGMRTFRREIMLAPGDEARVPVQFEAAVVDAGVSPVVRGSAGGAPAERPARSLAGPIVLLAAGATAWIATAPLLALREGALGALACSDPAAMPALCDDTQANRDRYEQARAFNTGLNVAWIAGGVLLAGGGAWLTVTLATTPRRAPSATARVQPLPLGASLVVTF